MAYMGVGFVAATVGGFEPAAEVLGGGPIIAPLDSFPVAVASSGYKDAIVFSLLIVILLVRPARLFGSPVEE